MLIFHERWEEKRRSKNCIIRLPSFPLSAQALPHISVNFFLTYGNWKVTKLHKEVKLEKEKSLINNFPSVHVYKFRNCTECIVFISYTATICVSDFCLFVCWWWSGQAQLSSRVVIQRQPRKKREFRILSCDRNRSVYGRTFKVKFVFKMQNEKGGKEERETDRQTDRHYFTVSFHASHCLLYVYHIRILYVHTASLNKLDTSCKGKKDVAFCMAMFRIKIFCMARSAVS